MRKNGFELVKTVSPSSGASVTKVVAKYTDNGIKSILGIDSGNLACRIMQAFDYDNLRSNLLGVFSNVFDMPEWEADEITHPAFFLPSAIAEEAAQSIVENNRWDFVLCKFDTEGKTRIPIPETRLKVSEFSGYTATITDKWFNAKGQEKGARIVITFPDDTSETIDVSLKAGHVAFKQWGMSTLYGTLVKKPLASQALMEAQALTKAVNTANTYHHVCYTFRRCDIGEAK